MTLASLCQFTAQHVSDVNTSIFRSLRLLDVLLCRLYCADFRRVGVRVVVQPTLGYHITNSQSRYITPTRLKSAHYSLNNNAQSSRKLLKMDVLTSETCWAVNWHNKASVIKLVGLPLFKYQDDARSNTHKIFFSCWNCYAKSVEQFPLCLSAFYIFWNFQ